jgi:hypothetical protein
MRKFASAVNEKLLNAGTPLLLMGIQWLYLWLFPWYKTYLENPAWGHNFVMSLAFFAVGLAYFSRKLLTDILSFIAAALIIPTTFGLIASSTSSIISSALVLLIIVDIIFERGYPLFQSTNSSAVDWLKKYLICFSYVLLVSLPPCYFLVELGAGTCDADLDSILFNIALLPFIILLLLERLPMAKNKVIVGRLGFFWGMLTMVVILAFMVDQPETLPNLVLSSLVTAAGLAALLLEGWSWE